MTVENRVVFKIRLGFPLMEPISELDLDLGLGLGRLAFPLKGVEPSSPTDAELRILTLTLTLTLTLILIAGSYLSSSKGARHPL